MIPPCSRPRLRSLRCRLLAGASSLALVALAGLCAACGQEDHAGPADGALSRGDSGARAPSQPPPNDAQRARFALDRLLEGPLPRTTAFPIPDLHPLNVRLAQADLVALPRATRELLDDPALVRRVTSAPRAARNPWYAILDVLLALPEKPASTVLAWTEPALGSQDPPIQRRSVEALAGVDDPRAADLLLRFLERRPRDPRLAPRAARVLVTRGSPWREEALSVLLARGTATTWNLVPGWLAADRASAAPAPGAPSALTAWALLAETSAPRPNPGIRRSVQPPWVGGRLLVDARVWPNDAVLVDASLAVGRAVAPAWVVEGAAVRTAVDPGRSSVVPYVALDRGGGPFAAALARCALARDGSVPGKASVRADERADDPNVAAVARACLARGASPDAIADARDLIGLFLDAMEAGETLPATGLVAALGTWKASGEPGWLEAAWRLLEAARPAPTYRGLLEGVHDLLRKTNRQAVGAWVKERLSRGEEGERNLALDLIRHAPDIGYAGALLAALGAEKENAPGRDALQRLLVWIQSRGEGATEATRAAFVPVFTRWLDETGDPLAAGLVGALLDLGEAGARAYATGLRGPRRALYVRGLLGRADPVSLEVARALLEPLDRATPAAERRAVLVAAYRTAPTEATPWLEAARSRLEATVRGEADDILEVVRHRAPRDRPGSAPPGG
ncbi:MAG: hypothetical protein ACC662_00990 [Planctomycetota bacterium]